MKPSIDVAFLCLILVSVAGAQPALEPIRKFPLAQSPITIRQVACPRCPFSVAGEHGALLGQQDGSFELWSFPYKVLQHARLTAELDDNGAAIDMNKQASTIEVAPERTTITYTHPAITIKQEMFALRGGADRALGVAILFAIDADKPAKLTIRFEPVMAPMWPAPLHGKPDTSWIKIGSGGGFLLSTGNPKVYGIVAMPRASPGALSPYPEPGQVHPLEFNIRVDPTRDRSVYFPLIALLRDGNHPLEPDWNALVERVIDVENRIPELYDETRSHYDRFFDNRVTAETPDAKFDQALKWAELSIDQMQVRFHDETGLVAGWSNSADTLRPGFGWFFGRDTLWTLYAVDSYGDFALSRRALEFLINRQRADGKIMHELTQSADLVDWKSFPYMYAAADSTPLFIMVMDDYVRASGDLQFLRAHWENVQRAYAFTRTHDSDGDGIYDNSQGTGWVESWPPGGPNQELYLAALDQQSAEAYARLAALTNHAAESAAARAVADDIRAKLARYRGPEGLYAFSRNHDGSYDRTPTIFPAVAWWTGRLSLPDADVTLSRWSSDEFFTDWGLRAVSDRSPVYQATSYHQGSVWPLFTGWSALAEYHADRPLSGYAQLMSNLQLTYLQDLGAVTELLSGDYYGPLEGSSARQMWSSAMVLSPALRGLFGIEADAVRHRLRVRPQLPASWGYADLRHVPYGKSELAVSMTRKAGELGIVVRSSSPAVLCIDTQAEFNDTECKAAPSEVHLAEVKLPGVEIGLPREELSPGQRTHQVKVLEQAYEGNMLTLKLEAPGGERKKLPIRRNGIAAARIRVEGAQLEGDELVVSFPSGEGYRSQQVVMRW
jgi:glycogen debranching enzyme